MACGNGGGSHVLSVASCGRGEFSDILGMNYRLTGSPQSSLSLNVVSTYGCIKANDSSDLHGIKFPPR